MDPKPPSLCHAYFKTQYVSAPNLMFFLLVFFLCASFPSRGVFTQLELHFNRQQSDWV